MRVLSTPQRGRAGRATLMKAGLALFSRKGFEDTSVEEICLAAGYSKGGFYFHFRGKDDLLAQILESDLEFVDRGMSPFLAELWAAAARNGSLRRQLRSREKRTFPLDGRASDPAAASLVDMLLTLKTGLGVRQAFLRGSTGEESQFVDSLLRVLAGSESEEPARRAS